MIESQLPPTTKNAIVESDRLAEVSYRPAPEIWLLSSLPVIQKIVGRKTRLSWQSEAADLIQEIVLRLVKWQNKYRAKSDVMTPDDWESFAARTSYNEINRSFSSRKLSALVPVEETPEPIGQAAVEGETEAEFNSLSRSAWREIRALSLRQRRALLLNSQELVVFLLKNIDETEMMEALGITEKQWDEIKENLPLTDAMIAGLCSETNKKGSAREKTGSIKKARHEARVKLRRLIGK